MTRTTCKPHQSEGGPPGWWKEIAATQLGGSGAAAGPHKGASRGARDTRPIGATGAREVPPGGCIEGVWSSGPTGLPPYVARARVARPTPGGQRGARAWPEKPKGNERKRKREREKAEANAIVSALAALEASNDEESKENDAGGKEDAAAHGQERAVYQQGAMHRGFEACYHHGETIVLFHLSSSDPRLHN